MTRGQYITVALFGLAGFLLARNVRGNVAPSAPGSPSLRDIPTTGIRFADNVERWRTFAGEASRQSGIPVNLILAVVAQESAGNPDAVGGVGEWGLMQLTDAAAQDANGPKTFDPLVNMIVGANFLSIQIDRMGGSLFDGLRAYNAGASGARQYPNRSVSYARSVLQRVGIDAG